MHIGHVQVLDEIFIPCSAALHAYASTVLGLVLCKRSPLYISEVGNRNHLIIIGIEVLRIELFRVRYDFRPSLVAVFGFEFLGFALDDVHLHCRICKYVIAPRNEFLQFIVLCLEFLSFESGELTELHLHDGCRLCVGECKCTDQCRFGLFYSLGSPDDSDDLVDNVDGLDETFEDMGSLLGFFQVELGPSDYNFVPEVHEHLYYILEAQCPWTALDECHIVYGET